MAGSEGERPGGVHESEVFVYPLTTRMGAGFGLVLSMATVGFCLAMPRILGPEPHLWIAQLVGVGVFSTVAAVSAGILGRALVRYRVDERGVTRLRPCSGPELLPWDRITRLVDHPVLGRLELLGEGPEGPVRFGLSYQLRGADRLRQAVMDQTDWEALVGEPGEEIALPGVVYRAWLHTVGRLGACAVVLWAVVEGWSAGRLPIWRVLATSSVGLLVPLVWYWYGIGLDHGSITLYYPLRRRTIAAPEVAAVRLGVQSETGSSTVIVDLHDGETLTLQGASIGSLRLYRLLSRAFPGKAKAAGPAS